MPVIVNRLSKIKHETKGFQEWYARMYPLKDINGNLTTFKRVKTITFQVTEDCSLACTYCYQTHKSKKMMSWDVAKIMVDKIFSGEDGFAEYINSPEAIVLEFIGGEPFLAIELIDRTVDYFRKKAIELDSPWAEKYMISICSNGIAYTDPKVQEFLHKNRFHLSFSITIDGTKELHDSCRLFPDGSPSYDIAHSAAMDWMSRGYFMGSKMTLAPENIDYFCDSLKQMIADGYQEINANVVFEDVWSIKDAQRAWKQAKEFSDWIRNSEYDQSDYDISYLQTSNKAHPLPELENNNWCGGTGSMLALDPDGILYPCLRYMKSSLGCKREPLSIGNVWDGIAQNDEEKKKVDCLNCITRRSQSTDECFYCPIAAGCAWCSAHNYEVHGTVDKRCTFICDMHKSRSLSIVYYWNHYFHEKGLDENVVDLWVPKQWAVPIIGEEEYQKLKDLTLQMGGFVNDSQTIVKGYESKNKSKKEE